MFSTIILLLLPGVGDLDHTGFDFLKSLKMYGNSQILGIRILSNLLAS